MFDRLFPSRRATERRAAESLYDRIVAAARQPAFYGVLGVPDTPIGRYEMIALHVFLFLHRVRGAAPPLKGIAQELTDTFFLEVEHSIRELGVGDLGVPKRMKKLARMFYGRAESYGAALDAEDAAALSAALARNVTPERPDWPGAASLAAYALAARRLLAAQSPAELESGRIGFPPVEEATR